MMPSVSRSLIGLTITFALLAAASGAQPPDVVQSDFNSNTAMGTGALSGLTGGTFNTAAGFQALA